MDDELIRTTDKAVKRLLRWLKHIEGLPSLSNDDLRSYVLETAYVLATGACRCGRRHCSEQHDLRSLPESGLMLQSFVFRAIIGPYGLKARSIEQGMLWPFLTAEWGIRAVLARFNQCPAAECGQKYEGGRCVRCGRPFSDDSTEVVGLPWLVKEGVYLPTRYWGCGDEKRRHYYLQVHCVERLVEATPAIRYRTAHGGRHDYCPWRGCPRGNPRHSQRGTTLWVRERFSPRPIMGSLPSTWMGTDGSLLPPERQGPPHGAD